MLNNTLNAPASQFQVNPPDPINGTAATQFGTPGLDGQREATAGALSTNLFSRGICRIKPARVKPLSSVE